MATKATNVDFRQGVEIIFADGVKRNIKPLTIRQLRKFMIVMKDMGDLESMAEISEDQITQMVNAAAIALEKDYADIAEDHDALEDILDLKSFNTLLAAAMGTDPNE